MAWCFPDEKADYPQAVLGAMDSVQAVVPALWPLEVANVLLVAERRKRCTNADTTTWLAFLGALPIRIDDATTERAWKDTLNLARAHSLSVYDAAYLELALRLTLPIATLDEPLQRAAAAIGVAPFSP